MDAGSKRSNWRMASSIVLHGVASRCNASQLLRQRRACFLKNRAFAISIQTRKTTYSCRYAGATRLYRTEGNHADTFCHKIVTKCVSCSIVRIRNDKTGTIVKQPNVMKVGGEQYIDELIPRERDTLAGRKIVGIDPNMGDLLCCVDSDARNQAKFQWCDNPRPYREGGILCHGLVKCQTCSRLWNRDTNASSNIWKVASNAIRG